MKTDFYAASTNNTSCTLKKTSLRMASCQGDQIMPYCLCPDVRRKVVCFKFGLEYYKDVVCNH